MQAPVTLRAEDGYEPPTGTSHACKKTGGAGATGHASCVGPFHAHTAGYLGI